MTRDELEAALLRYFHADALAPAERARLVDAALAFVADPRRRGGQLGLFAPHHPIGHGLAWWEERQRGSRELVMPTFLDHALMELISDPVLEPLPVPRPHCPPELIGRWELVGTSPDDTRLEPPPAPRAWIFGAGGAFATEGDERRATWSWRVHEAGHRILCLGPASDPLRDQWTFIEPDETYAPPPADGEVDLMSADATRGFDRWRRVRRAD